MHVKTEDDVPRKGRRSAAEAAETRAALLAAGRELFGAPGYAAVGVEDIARRAGVTRGALYHHFGGKQGLLREVFEDLERELTETIGAAVLAEPDPGALLRAGAAAWLDACLDPVVERIVLLDAPSVLGWDVWREVAERYGLGLVQAALTAAMEAGSVRRLPVAPLAHVMLGALDEAALYVARAEDRAAARADAEVVVVALLDGLAP